MQVAGAQQAPPSLTPGAPDLMAQVRALYEATAVPVREIARRAGVAERTLYKYARKQNWKPRYAWTPDGARPVGRAAPRRWSEAQEREHERASQVAPAKGAGGRFIRREDIGEPFAQGLKALDPAGRAAAAAACAEADRAVRRAQAEADAEAQCQKHLRIIESVGLAFAEYNAFRRDRAGRGPRPFDGRLARLHVDFINTMLRRWEWFIAHEDIGIVAVECP